MSYKFPTRLNTLFTVLTPKVKMNDYGTADTEYLPGSRFWGFKRTFNGTETTVNGVLVVKNTAVIDCYYNSQLSADCRLQDTQGRIWKIITEPENINGECKYMQFKIEHIDNAERDTSYE